MGRHSKKKGEHEEGSNDFEKKGQGVADLWEDTYEDAVVNGFIWFPGLGVKSQYVQEIVSFTGTHQSRPDHSVLSLSFGGTPYSLPSS